MAKIKVLLADDHTVVRQGLSALFHAEADIQVVGEAATGQQAIQLAMRLKPDVVVMDIVMPVLNGLEATRQILNQNPSCRVLIFSAYHDSDYVHDSAEAGAMGYVLKDTNTSAADLIKAIREVSQGNSFLSPAISKHLMGGYRGAVAHGFPASKRRHLLSPRETEVLRCVAMGKANKQIADDLQISIKTVQRHRQKVMDKLNIHNTAGLTRYAISKELIDNRQEN